MIFDFIFSGESGVGAGLEADSADHSKCLGLKSEVAAFVDFGQTTRQSQVDTLVEVFRHDIGVLVSFQFSVFLFYRRLKRHPRGAGLLEINSNPRWSSCRC